MRLAEQAQAETDPERKARLFQQALGQWNDPNIRFALVQSLIQAADAAHQSSFPRNTAALDRADQFLNEAEAIDRGDLSSLDGYSNLYGWLQASRNRIAARRSDLATRARVEAGLQDANTRISQMAEQFAREFQVSENGAGSGLTFGVTPTSEDNYVLPPLPPAPPPFQRGLPRLEEVENSPGYEAWLRGMDAVVRRDWILAAAWFGTAQLRDPTNTAFGRAVELSEWTRDFYLRPQARVVTAMRAPTNDDLELLFPTPTPEQLPALTPEESRRIAIARAINTVAPEDFDLLSDTTAQRGAMVDAVPFHERRRLVERGLTQPSAGDWTDTLAPEVRGMVAELRESLPPRRYGPPNPNASRSEQIDAATSEISQSFADEAIVRVLNGNLAEAERAFDDAGQYAPGYAPALDLIRTWRGQSSEGEITGLAPGGSSPQH